MNYSPSFIWRQVLFFDLCKIKGRTSAGTEIRPSGRVDDGLPQPTLYGEILFTYYKTIVNIAFTFNGGIMIMIFSTLSLGARIKQARTIRKISQEELANLCGWNNRMRICQYENGKRIPSIESIERISRSLKVDAGWLSFGYGVIEDAMV